MRVLVKLNEVEKVKDFVNMMTANNIDCYVKSLDRNYVVDGRSILGVFSLDLSKEIEVECVDPSVLDLFEEIVENFQ